jgi:tetratricopeptide (TPR) repeat protein
MSPRTTAALACVLAGWMGVARLAAAADTLAQAKELYASAAYDEALAVLDRLQSAASKTETASIAEYRVFCLLALNRRDEAQKDIEDILHSNPLYMPSGDQASPRIQGVFRDVRRQSLPKIVLERYAVAKASFERKDPNAGPQFDDVLALMDDPDVQATPALNDLRTVVTAFRDLTKAMVATPTPASAAQAQAITPLTPAGPELSPERLRVFTSADADVAPPVAQSQRIPPWVPDRAIAAQDFHGTLELLIDETGGVVTATMRASAHPTYNRLLLRAARDWKFTPARHDGKPVRYLKIVEVHLKPAS